MKLRMAGALAIVILASTAMPVTHSTAADGTCGTQKPDRPPTTTTFLGSHWADSQGAGSVGPNQNPAYGQVTFADATAQGSLGGDHSTQYVVSPERVCVHAGAIRAGEHAPEFAITAPPAIESMPWLRREGRFWAAPDGRRTILHGVDYLYNRPGINAHEFNLLDEDFDRIRSWGMNLLRIRVRDARAGYFPGTVAEPGFLENLDHVIAAANRRGIYVILATGGPETQGHVTEGAGPGHDQLKFVAGTPAQAHWLGYLESIWSRYREWPGVVGFDAVNEDLAYPPAIHDQVFMAEGHRAAVARLRASDTRHVYFQQPSGWGYWNVPGTVGHDVGDANRNFCFKWSANAQQGAELSHERRMSEMVRQATAAGTPLFICEYVMYRNDRQNEDQNLALQRSAIHAMDAHLVGSARNLYGDQDLNGLLLPGRVESYWIRELVRPYPMWVGGEVTSLAWDFDARRLDVAVSLDGSGPTEVFVSPSRTYPDGFVATAGAARLVHNGTAVVAASGGLRWDAQNERVVLVRRGGEVSLTITPSS